MSVISGVCAPIIITMDGNIDGFNSCGYGHNIVINLGLQTDWVGLGND